MKNDADAEILKAHAKLLDALKNIKPYPSTDKNVVLRDRASRTIAAFMEYLITTSTDVGDNLNALHSLIIALHDADNGRADPLLTPFQAKAGRASLTRLHLRRAVILQAVIYLLREGIAKSESKALEVLSHMSGVACKRLKSDLNKARHDANLDVFDPQKITIPNGASAEKLAAYIRQLFDT